MSQVGKKGSSFSDWLKQGSSLTDLAIFIECLWLLWTVNALSCCSPPLPHQKKRKRTNSLFSILLSPSQLFFLQQRKHLNVEHFKLGWRSCSNTTVGIVWRVLSHVTDEYQFICSQRLLPWKGSHGRSLLLNLFVEVVGYFLPVWRLIVSSPPTSPKFLVKFFSRPTFTNN